MGIESGGDAVLDFMRNGVTGAGHATAMARLRRVGVRVAARSR
ncbi:MAG TPA: hypothetical protein PLR71_12855 [Deltaproteobacteria bacterium]|nr:hypothetical protein [Deltaproteobacteria bacterium]